MPRIKIKLDGTLQYMEDNPAAAILASEDHQNRGASIDLGVYPKITADHINKFFQAVFLHLKVLTDIEFNLKGKELCIDDIARYLKLLNVERKINLRINLECEVEKWIALVLQDLNPKVFSVLNIPYLQGDNLHENLGKILKICADKNMEFQTTNASLNRTAKKIAKTITYQNGKPLKVTQVQKKPMYGYSDLPAEIPPTKALSAAAGHAGDQSVSKRSRSPDKKEVRASRSDADRKASRSRSPKRRDDRDRSVDHSARATAETRDDSRRGRDQHDTHRGKSKDRRDARSSRDDRGRDLSRSKSPKYRGYDRRSVDRSARTVETRDRYARDQPDDAKRSASNDRMDIRRSSRNDRGHYASRSRSPNRTDDGRSVEHQSKVLVKARAVVQQPTPVPAAVLSGAAVQQPMLIPAAALPGAAVQQPIPAPAAAPSSSATELPEVKTLGAQLRDWGQLSPAEQLRVYSQISAQMTPAQRNLCAQAMAPQPPQPAPQPAAAQNFTQAGAAAMNSTQPGIPFYPAPIQMPQVSIWPNTAAFAPTYVSFASGGLVGVAAGSTYAFFGCSAGAGVANPPTNQR